MLLQIETNTRCNLACWFCQNRHFPLPEKAVMPMPLYELAVGQGQECGYRRVSHAAYNEPMADPLFLDRLRFLKRQRVEYVGYSNGTLLDAFTAQRLVAEGLDWPHTFNIPAADQEAYARAVDRTRSAAAVIDQVRAFIRASRRDHVVDVNGVGDAEHDENYRQVSARFADLPNCQVRRVVIVTRAGQMCGTGRADFGANLQQLTLRKPFPVVGCAAGKLANVYVGVYGEVYLCCHDHEKKYTVGNIETEPLAAIINSERRSNIERVMFAELCASCESAVFRRTARDGFRADLPHQLQPPHLAPGDVRPA